MKPSHFLWTCLLLVVSIAFPQSPATADLILAYDSLLPGSGGSATALSRIDGQTDSAFVTSSAATNSLGNRATMAAIHGSQTQVQGPWGDQNDLQFRFGSSSGGNGTMAGALTSGHAAAGPRIDFSYTAAKAQTLDQFSFDMFVNSNNGSSYGARDAGLFVRSDGGTFFQFGDLYLTGGPNGNQGTITFSDNLLVESGELVEFRLAFTDRTRTNNDLQAATRIGNVQIFASAVPEPSSLVYFSIAGLGVLVRRRRNSAVSELSENG